MLDLTSSLAAPGKPNPANRLRCLYNRGATPRPTPHAPRPFQRAPPRSAPRSSAARLHLPLSHPAGHLLRLAQQCCSPRSSHALALWVVVVAVLLLCAALVYIRLDLQKEAIGDLSEVLQSKVAARDYPDAYAPPPFLPPPARLPSYPPAPPPARVLARVRPRALSFLRGVAEFPMDSRSHVAFARHGTARLG